jgi:hypothetical protein
LFEHGSVPRVVALFDLVNHVLKRKAKALLLAEPGGRFRRQTWVSGSASFRCLVLLCLDGLAFPSSGHVVDYSCPQRRRFQRCGMYAPEPKASPLPSWERSVRKTDLAKKTDYSLEN